MVPARAPDQVNYEVIMQEFFLRLPGSTLEVSREHVRGCPGARFDRLPGSTFAIFPKRFVLWVLNPAPVMRGVSVIFVGFCGSVARGARARACSRMKGFANKVLPIAREHD